MRQLPGGEINVINMWVHIPTRKQSGFYLFSDEKYPSTTNACIPEYHETLALLKHEFHYNWLSFC